MVALSNADVDPRKVAPHIGILRSTWFGAMTLLLDSCLPPLLKPRIPTLQHKNIFALVCSTSTTMGLATACPTIASEKAACRVPNQYDDCPVSEINTRLSMKPWADCKPHNSTKGHNEESNAFATLEALPSVLIFQFLAQHLLQAVTYMLHHWQLRSRSFDVDCRAS